MNEPKQAESLCLDILEIDSENQEAPLLLLLALTDEFSHAERETYRRARDLIPKIRDEYQKTCASQTRILTSRRCVSTSPSITLWADSESITT